MHDLIIIGGSAAATSAGVYAARRGLNFKIITKDFGGEVITSGEIGNWPGINQTDGITLSKQFKEHLKFYKADLEEGVEVQKISVQPDGSFCITAKKGSSTSMASEKTADSSGSALKCDYEAKSIVFATGVHPRELGITGEKQFRNKGVSYCTTCDGPLFGGRVVATIGGGNSALESALMLADIASKVYVINKNAQFKGEQVLIDNLMKKQNVEILYETGTKEIAGEQFVNTLKCTDKDGNEKELKVDGIFVHIGMVPNSDIAPEGIAKNQFGEIMVDKACVTNIPGFFAAGDVTDVPFKQIVIASGMGCISTLSAVQYLNKLVK